MRIIAVYKTFRGEEFALDSVASIYPHVRNILFVHSETGWTGETGNTVRSVVAGAPDPEGKIIHIEKNGSQNEQYTAATRYIFENHENMYDYIMLIDTDEVWQESEWIKAKRHLRENLDDISPAMAIRCGLFDYIKSPFYRIDPPAPLKPVVFVHSAAIRLFDINTRGDAISPVKIINDVWFHHFCSVRKSLRCVLGKHTTSCAAEDEPLVDQQFWVKHVWNQLPYAKDLLPLKKYRDSWKGAKVIKKTDLPEAVVNNPLVLAWEKYPGITFSNHQSNMVAALKKVGLPEDFAPGHPDWKMPSKQRRYEQAMEALSND